MKQNYFRPLPMAVLFFVLAAFASGSFKTEQKKYPRVREAYQEKEKVIESLLNKISINPNGLKIYLRAFKAEKEIELWANDNTGKQYKLLKTYKVCRTSGSYGPKRKRGDFQIPEGYYHIDRFNPASSYHLSLGVNYPNTSDRILASSADPGGDIFIHGSCVTIGCLPVTDDLIKELYIFAVEAKDSGQEQIPVTIFPARLTASKHAQLKNHYKDDQDKIDLWADLKEGYDFFNEHKTVPKVVFLSNGRHKLIR